MGLQIRERSRVADYSRRSNRRYRGEEGRAAWLPSNQDSCSRLSTAIANFEGVVQVADNKLGWISCYDVGRFNISPSKFQSLMNTRSLVDSWLFRGPAAPLL